MASIHGVFFYITAGFYWFCFKRTLMCPVLSKFLCLCFLFFVMIWLIQINSLIFSAALAGCVVSSVGCKNRLSDLSPCRNQELCPRHAIYHWHCLNCIIFISQSVVCGLAQGHMFLKKSLRWRASPANYSDRISMPVSGRWAEYTLHLRSSASIKPS